MIPVLLRLGPFTIYSYGLMMAFGFIAGDLVLGPRMPQAWLQPGAGQPEVVWGAIAGIAGSRIYDVFDNWAAYKTNLRSIVLSGSGFVWYGGLIAGIVATWLVARYYKVSFLTLADMCAPALVLGQAFGRMGCQLSGDGDWGMPSTLPWAMAYPKAIVGWGPQTVLNLDAQENLVSGFFPGVRVHPTPVYEVILYTAIFSRFVVVTRKNQRRRAYSLPLFDIGGRRTLHGRIRTYQSARLHGTERGATYLARDGHCGYYRMVLVGDASACRWQTRVAAES